jgi:hypothetical protein
MRLIPVAVTNSCLNNLLFRIALLVIVIFTNNQITKTFMQKMNLLALVLLVLLFASCKKDNRSDLSQHSSEETNFLSSDDLKVEFAKTLGKAMAEPGVRSLLKEEALKKFDNDCDVLFQLVKDKEVKPGITFLQYLNSLSSTQDAFSNLAEDAPLLTILVPHLSVFSAAKWNINDEIPVVAVLKNDFSEKNHTPLPAFDRDGNQLSFESNKAPKRPVVVVKENERLVGVSATTRNARTLSGKQVFANKSASFYFADDSFNGDRSKQTQAETSLMSSAHVDPKLQAAYDQNMPSQRDYVYYNISTPTGQGTLDHTYAEYLTAFWVNTKNTLDNYLNDDPTSDWSDGDLEFQMDVLMFGGESTLNKVTKVFVVPRAGMWSDDGNTVTQYVFPQPIQIATWDMKEMGGLWKYVVTEIDPATVTTTTQTSSTKFGANWNTTGSVDLGPIKLGVGYGVTGEKIKSATTVTQITTGSDLCGEAVADFMQPVVTGKFNLTFPRKTVWAVNELNTGSVTFTVIPKKVL